MEKDGRIINMQVTQPVSCLEDNELNECGILLSLSLAGSIILKLQHHQSQVSKLCVYIRCKIKAEFKLTPQQRSMEVKKHRFFYA